MKTFGHRDDQREISDRLQSLRSTDGPHWGSMYAGAMVKHLAESYEMAMQRLPANRPAYSWLRGPHGRWLAFRLPLTWGKNMPTLPELNIMLRENYTIDFAAEHAFLLKIVEDFWSSSEEQLRPEHPLLGRLTREDWMRWGYLHADHHLRQFGK